jgi:outer membrane protein assembly factor BamB
LSKESFVPHDAAPTVSPPTRGDDRPEAPEFPADTRILTLGAQDFAAGGVRASRLLLKNPHHTILHVRVVSTVEWITVAPVEVALGPDEQQHILVRTDTEKARASVRAGGPPTIPLQIAYQRLYPGGRGVTPPPPEVSTITVRLPIASCPACGKSLESVMGENDTDLVPEFCPFCFERLRACPVCATPNSWLARRCIRDSSHVIRALPDWNVLGGSPAHTGSIPDRAAPLLSRRWSFPTVPPARREAALAWSAPVAAYGLVAAAAATTDGEAHLYAFDATTGAPLWDAYPLPDPVYPDRGGAALAGGRLFAATYTGACVAVDAQRGTRIWETSLPGRVIGAVVPVGENGPLLVNVITGDGEGALCILEAATGSIRHKVPLRGAPDTAPAYTAVGGGLILAQDDGGHITAIELATGAVRWTEGGEAGFDSAPMIYEEHVFATTVAGMAVCRHVESGAEVWRISVTNAPFTGTPAHDGTLLYLPANDGLHLISAGAGRAVRRYPTRLPVRSAPVIAGGTLFFGVMDGNIYGTAGGRPLEKLYETGATGSQIVAAPAFADGALFVAATNGVLYALQHTQPNVPGPPGATTS